jgi:hypothetical protein
MIFFLTSHSLWLSGFIIIGLGTLLATLGPTVVRHFVDLKRLSANNEIAGFKFATVGVLYAVLLAFATIVVWQKYSDAETTVAQEAGAAASIFQLSYGIDEKPGIALRSALNNYLTHAIADDWPAMERVAPGGSPSARHALDTVYTALLTLQSNSPIDAVVLAEILHQVDILTGAGSGLAYFVRRRHHHARVHFFLRRGELASADADDLAARRAHALRTVHHRRH